MHDVCSIKLLVQGNTIHTVQQNVFDCQWNNNTFRGKVYVLETSTGMKIISSKNLVPQNYHCQGIAGKCQRSGINQPCCNCVIAHEIGLMFGLNVPVTFIGFKPLNCCHIYTACRISFKTTHHARWFHYKHIVVSLLWNFTL